MLILLFASPIFAWSADAAIEKTLRRLNITSWNDSLIDIGTSHLSTRIKDSLREKHARMVKAAAKELLPPVLLKGIVRASSDENIRQLFAQNAVALDQFASRVSTYANPLLTSWEYNATESSASRGGLNAALLVACAISLL